jgi:hypothetical protein
MEAYLAEGKATVKERKSYHCSSSPRTMPVPTTS